MHLSFSLLQVLSRPAYNICEKVCARDLSLSIDRDLISHSLTFHYESYMSFVKKRNGNFSLCWLSLTVQGWVFMTQSTLTKLTRCCIFLFITQFWLSQISGKIYKFMSYRCPCVMHTSSLVAYHITSFMLYESSYIDVCFGTDYCI